MERIYLVYILESPCGGVYVGCTRTSLKERFRHHVRRAKSGYIHPLAEAIRSQGADLFKLEVLSSWENRDDAWRAEEVEISLARERGVCFNISDGGFHDGRTSNRILRERISKDPVFAAAYYKKLSESFNRDFIEKRAEAAKIALVKWRKENPKEAYRLAYRGIRLANKATQLSRGTPVKPEVLGLKERLFRKHKPNEFKSRYVTEVWANRSAEEVESLGAKISESLKEYHKTKTPEELKAQTSKARGAIDKKKQAAAASKGLKKFWENLRKDPEAYRAYMIKRGSWKK